MKLKKIASLMLAGVMAASMLAGCSNTSGNGGQLPPDDDDISPLRIALSWMLIWHMLLVLRMFGILCWAM